jgi:hypothetical protein
MFYIGPVLDINFPATKPCCVDGEGDRLKPSHFSPFYELPHYIPVLINLMYTVIHVMNKVGNNKQSQGISLQNHIHKVGKNVSPVQLS